MGFKSVYRSLQEVFPQIDARILKAVAIERSKDVDAAVNDILTDVLPYLTSRQSMVINDSPVAKSSSVEPEGHATLPRPHPTVDQADAGSLSEPKLIAGENAVNSDSTSGAVPADSMHPDGMDDIGSSSKLRSIGNENVEYGDCRNGDGGVMQLDQVDDRGWSSELSATDSENAKNSDCANGAFHADLTNQKAVNESIVSSSLIAKDSDDQLGVDSMSEELILLGKTHEMQKVLDLGQNGYVLSNDLKQKGTDDQVCMNTENEVLISHNRPIAKVGSEQTSFGESTSSIHEKGGFTDKWNDPPYGCNDFHYSIANESYMITSGVHKDSCLLDPEIFGALPVPLSVQVQTADTKECDLQSGFHCDSSITNNDESEVSVILSLTSNKDSSVSEMGSIDIRNNIVTQSGQICRIDILDEIIEDAKNNKKTLFSAMESVMNMMKEVELKERAAECAKEEAAQGGLDILIKVEELKKMLTHAKEANSMHAGEVYGEKAILATELRELQSRLLCLLDERDKSLATLDEMRQTLEARLAAAEELRKAAEQEKLEREESAMDALAEQEAIMDNVVQESKFIEQAAEENSKLREFLVDRGHIVDVLQGEISVICQDVSLLKEKFDMRVPLSMSVSSSQTSCKLASSGSSLKSVTSILVPEEGELSKSSEKDRIPEEGVSSNNSEKERSPVLSISNLTLKGRAEEDSVKSNGKELLEEGWDIFDKDAELDVETWEVKIPDKS